MFDLPDIPPRIAVAIGGPESAHRLIRFGPLGWKVQAELPNPVNFEAATAFVTPDGLKQTVACGPDPDGFFDFFTRELADPCGPCARPEPRVGPVVTTLCPPCWRPAGPSPP